MMELTIENLRTLAQSGQIFLTAYWPDLDHWNATYTERKKKGE